MSTDLGNVVQMTQFFIARIYGILVHIRAVKFEENIVYVSTYHTFFKSVLEVPGNGMCRCERLGVKIC